MPIPTFVVTPNEPMNAREWVLPTNHGGFAMGTASGVPSRKYHTLLNAAANPPVDRYAAWNALDETFEIDGVAIDLARYRTGNKTPDPAPQLERFVKDGDGVAWTWRIAGAMVEKRLFVAHHANVAAVRYDVAPADRDRRLLLRPRFTLRDMHETVEDVDPLDFDVTIRADALTITRGRLTSRLAVAGGRVEASDDIRRGVVYERELERRYPGVEDLYAPAVIVCEIPAGQSARVVVSCGFGDEAPDLDLASRHERRERLEGIVERFLEDGREEHVALVVAADDFLVRREVDGRALTSVIAGYPWFADWGRDTMIALPGLLLATGRTDEAYDTLAAYARHIDRGMIPNHFDDHGGPPHYNTVDASLWFVNACFAYQRRTDDPRFEATLRPACRDVIEHYRDGTRYDIRMDPSDGLIMSGDETTQLTWMDAKREGVVFTPRHGKAVEINALWHNALVLMGETELAARVKASFDAQFIPPERDRLYDCLHPDGCVGWRAVDEIRPNMVIAAGLPQTPLDRAMRRAVVACARERLLTPCGLRTLSADDAKYQPLFKGDMMSRDRAYHNGTVWPWLIGSYCAALVASHEDATAARAEARSAIDGLVASLERGCVGQIAEIFDAEPTDGARLEEGCVGQAWSVAEVLRVAAWMC